MPGSLLPDTNAFIALLRGDPIVVDMLDSASEVVLSAVVLGELTYGAMNSRATDANLKRLQDLRAECRFAPVDEAVVTSYGQVRLALKQKGRPIPENDIGIAATAIANGAVVLTEDLHFREIEGLVLAQFR